MLLLRFGYLFAGIALLSRFYFTPWWSGSWWHFGLLLGWALAGVWVDPFRFHFNAQKPTNRLAPLVQRRSFLIVSLLLLLPFIAWAADWYWYFPWLPWWTLAVYWAPRDLLLCAIFVFWIRITFDRISLGRQLCLLFTLLLISHLMLILAYAGISGTPEYLQDGETQNCFLHQLWFKLTAGTVIFRKSISKK